MMLSGVSITNILVFEKCGQNTVLNVGDIFSIGTQNQGENQEIKIIKN